MPAPPTIKEIARRLNISASTVSRALHDHPSIGLRTKTRVQQLAAELNYEPNQTAMKNILKLALLTVLGASLSSVAFAQLPVPPVLPPPPGAPAPPVLPAPPAPP